MDASRDANRGPGEEADRGAGTGGAAAPADAVPVIRRGVPRGGEAQVAALYWEAFGRKLAPALDPPDTGRAFLAAHLQHDRAVTAVAGGRVVGVAGYQLGGRALTGGSVRDVLDTYGMLRGLPRLAVLALFERTPAEGELVMDGIAVAEAHRGSGIGSRLLREIAAVAAESGCRRVRLDVIDVNPRARALYERHGFVAGRTERTPYLRRLMGFGAVTTMDRPVGPADLRRPEEAAGPGPWARAGGPEPDEGEALREDADALPDDAGPLPDAARRGEAR